MKIELHHIYALAGITSIIIMIIEKSYKRSMEYWIIGITLLLLSLISKILKRIDNLEKNVEDLNK